MLCCTLILGTLTEERLREIMTTMGDRWTDEMVDELLYGAPISVSSANLFCPPPSFLVINIKS